MRRLRRPLPLALLAVLAAAPAARAADWGPTVSLTDALPGDPRPLVAVDPRGDAAVAWVDGGQNLSQTLAVAYRPAGGTFGPREIADTSGQGEFLAAASPAIAPNGTVTLGWLKHPSAVRSRQRHPDGTYGPISDVAPDTPGLFIEGASDAAGHSSIVWNAGSGAMLARTDGTAPFAGSTAVPESDIDSAAPAVGPGGVETFALPGANGQILASSRQSDGSFSTPAPINPPSTEGGTTSAISIKVNAAGDSVIAWIVYPASYSDPRRTFVAIGHDGTYGPPQELGQGIYPSLALNDRGDAAAIWAGGDYVSRTQIAFRTPGQGFGPPQALGGCNASAGGVVLDSAGDALATWQEGGAANRRNPDHIASAVRPAGGAMGAPEFVTAPSPLISAPDLGIDAAGRVTAAWVTHPQPAGILGSSLVQAASTTAPLSELAAAASPASADPPYSCHPRVPLAAPAPPAPRVELGGTLHLPRHRSPFLDVACPPGAGAPCTGVLSLSGTRRGRPERGQEAMFAIPPGTRRSVAVRSLGRFGSDLRSGAIGVVRARAVTSRAGGASTPDVRDVVVGRAPRPRVRDLGPATRLVGGGGALAAYSPSMGTTRVYVAATGERFDVATPYTCNLAGAGGGRLAFGCPPDDLGAGPGENLEQALVLDADRSDWSRPDIATDSSNDSRTIEDVGRWWLRAGVSGYHYSGAPTYLPIRAGAHATNLGGQAVVPDLNRPDLYRPLCAPLGAPAYGTRFLYDPPYALSTDALGSTDYDSAPSTPLVLSRCGRGPLRTLARCRRGCSSVTLSHGLITWIERGRAFLAHATRGSGTLLGVPRGLTALSVVPAGARALVLAQRGQTRARVYLVPLPPLPTRRGRHR